MMNSDTTRCHKLMCSKHRSSNRNQYSGMSACKALVLGIRVIRLQPCICLAVCLLLCSASLADAFSVHWEEPMQEDNDVAPEQNEDTNHVDQYINVLKRWGFQSRFPWKRLRGGMCFRQPCKRDKECCKRYSICDKSARVCVDCWYGSSCKSERDCCMNYPYCARVWKKSHNGKRYISHGKCVTKL